MERQTVIQSLIDLVERKNTHIDPYADSVVTRKFDTPRFKAYMEKNTFESPRELFEVYVGALYFALTGQPFPEGIDVVEKSVENAEFAIFLRQMFPNCRFLHIVRNPYASLVAIRRAKTNKRYPFLCNFVLSLQNSYYYLLKNQRLLDNYLVIRYEDLLTSTEATMRKVADFLNFKFTEELLVPTLMEEPWGGNSSSGKSFTKISSTPLKNWENQINDFEIHLINSFLTPALEQLGYERMIPKKSQYFPLQGEGFRTYWQNRSLLWLAPPSRNVL